MTHDEKVAFLLKELGQKGISQYTTAPPLYRLLWRLGIKVKPPFFVSFWFLAVTMGGYFGVFWGIFMWFVFWQQRLPVSVALESAVFAGVLFGLSMAAYYRWRAGKLGLPRWEDYPAA